MYGGMIAAETIRVIPVQSLTYFKLLCPSLRRNLFYVDTQRKYFQQCPDGACAIITTSGSCNCIIKILFPNNEMHYLEVTISCVEFCPFFQIPCTS